MFPVFNLGHFVNFILLPNLYGEFNFSTHSTNLIANSSECFLW